MQVSLSISIYEDRNRLSDIIYNSILVEKIDKEYVKIEKNPLKIEIKVPSVTRARAIMNSYILWIYTILKSLEEVERFG
ncbi:MAG: KEOPS complex subunit Pcc1 [Saccharolobus sp.]